MQGSPVDSKNAYHGSDTDIIQHPIKIIAGVIADLQNGFYSLFSLENQLLYELELIDALENAKEFASLAKCFSVKRNVRKRVE
jgi:hypothetical protein